MNNFHKLLHRFMENCNDKIRDIIEKYKFTPYTVEVEAVAEKNMGILVLSEEEVEVKFAA